MNGSLVDIPSGATENCQDSELPAFRMLVDGELVYFMTEELGVTIPESHLVMP